MFLDVLFHYNTYLMLGEPLIKEKTSRNIKKYTKHEVNIMIKKQVKKGMKQKKRKHTQELRAFEKMSVSDSDQESMNSSSSEEGEI